MVLCNVLMHRKVALDFNAPATQLIRSGCKYFHHESVMWSHNFNSLYSALFCSISIRTQIIINAEWKGSNGIRLKCFGEFCSKDTLAHKWDKVKVLWGVLFKRHACTQLL